MTRVLPLFLTLVNVFQRWRLATGSIPVVGSSRNTIGGSPISAIAVLNFRLFPPLDNNKKQNESWPKDKSWSCHTIAFCFIVHQHWQETISQSRTIKTTQQISLTHKTESISTKITQQTRLITVCIDQPISRHTKKGCILWSLISQARETVHYIPELAGLFASVFLKHCQRYDRIYRWCNRSFGDATQPGKHVERLADRHLIDQCIELWTVAELFLCLSKVLGHAVRHQESVAIGRPNVPRQHLERGRLTSAVDTKQTEAFTLHLFAPSNSAD